VKFGREPIKVEKEHTFRKEYETVDILHFGLQSSFKMTISGDPEVMAMMKKMKIFIFVSDPSAAAKENSEQAKRLRRVGRAAAAQSLLLFSSILAL
jgi:hypothetical protein